MVESGVTVAGGRVYVGDGTGEHHGCAGSPVVQVVRIPHGRANLTGPEGQPRVNVSVLT
jgi:hypothetical protein